MNDDQAKPAAIAEDAEIIRRNVRAALNNPLALAQIAAALDPRAVCRGEMQEPLERAAALIMEAGLLSERMGRDPLSDVVFKLGKLPADYHRNVAAAGSIYFPKVEPPVLILSEADGRDTIRDFLRQHVNFEGKEAKGKRVAWGTTRMVKDHLQRWFIDRANDHNRAFGGVDWRAGLDEFSKSKKEWSEANDGDWKIPREQLLAPSEQSGTQSAPPALPPLDWRFVPWCRRTKGHFKSIRQLTLDELFPAPIAPQPPQEKSLRKSQKKLTPETQ